MAGDRRGCSDRGGFPESAAAVGAGARQGKREACAPARPEGDQEGLQGLSRPGEHLLRQPNSVWRQAISGEGTEGPEVPVVESGQGVRGNPQGATEILEKVPREGLLAMPTEKST